jgi:uncharacterized membrane protein YdjX (TVP38/TMEM64 family)
MNEARPPSSTWGRVARALLGLLLVALVVLAARSSSQLDCDAARAIGARDDSARWATLIFFGAVLLAIPRAIVIVVAGVVFGTGWGSLIAQLAAWLAALAAFLIARYIARDATEAYLGRFRWFGSLKSELGTSGTWYSFLLRLNPVLQFTLVSYACGLLPLGFWPYAAGTFLGMAPGSLIMAYAGDVVGCALLEEDVDVPNDAKIYLGASWVVLNLLSIVPVIVQRRRRRRQGARSSPG